MSIKPPRTYAEWAKVLDMLKDRTDDEAVLAAMQAGTIEWQAGVAERFTERLVETVNYRMNTATDKFQREISRAYGQESAIVRALLALRNEMRFLVQAIGVNAIPAGDRERYKALITEQANKMQSSLEDSAKADRTGKLLSIIRNNRVNSI